MLEVDGRLKVVVVVVVVLRKKRRIKRC